MGHQLDTFHIEPGFNEPGTESKPAWTNGTVRFGSAHSHITALFKKDYTQIQFCTLSPPKRRQPPHRLPLHRISMDPPSTFIELHINLIMILCILATVILLNLQPFFDIFYTFHLG
jgi:hypothetical protein